MDNKEDSIMTQLHDAICYESSIEKVKCLIDSKVDINKKDKCQETPLHMATNKIRPNVDIVRYLLKSKADPNIVDYYNNVPLHYILKSHNHQLSDIIQLLIDNKANVNIPDKDGLTPLHIICSRNYLYKDCEKIVKLLLDNKANVHAKDKLNDTPIQLLQLNSKTNSVLKLLLDSKADINQLKLHHVTSESTMKLLLKSGIRVQDKSSLGLIKTSYPVCINYIKIKYIVYMKEQRNILAVLDLFLYG